MAKKQRKATKAKADNNNHRQQLREQSCVIRGLLDDNDSLRGRLRAMQTQKQRATRQAAGRALGQIANAMGFLSRYCQVYDDPDVCEASALAGAGLLFMAADATTANR